MCASRGRNPERPEDRRPGINLVQILELKKQSNISFAITTVSKDFLLLEIYEK